MTWLIAEAFGLVGCGWMLRWAWSLWTVPEEAPGGERASGVAAAPATGTGGGEDCVPCLVSRADDFWTEPADDDTFIERLAEDVPRREATPRLSPAPGHTGAHRADDGEAAAKATNGPLSADSQGGPVRPDYELLIGAALTCDDDTWQRVMDVWAAKETA